MPLRKFFRGAIPLAQRVRHAKGDPNKRGGTFQVVKPQKIQKPKRELRIEVHTGRRMKQTRNGIYFGRPKWERPPNFDPGESKWRRRMRVQFWGNERKLLAPVNWKASPIWREAFKNQADTNSLYRLAITEKRYNQIKTILQKKGVWTPGVRKDSDTEAASSKNKSDEEAEKPVKKTVPKKAAAPKKASSVLPVKKDVKKEATPPKKALPVAPKKDAASASSAPKAATPSTAGPVKKDAPKAVTAPKAAAAPKSAVETAAKSALLALPGAAGGSSMLKRRPMRVFNAKKEPRLEASSSSSSSSGAMPQPVAPRSITPSVVPVAPPRPAAVLQLSPKRTLPATPPKEAPAAKQHAYRAYRADGSITTAYCSEVLRTFIPSDWDFLWETSVRNRSLKNADLGILWTDMEVQPSETLSAVYVIGFINGSSIAREGVRLPSKLVSLNGERVEGMRRDRFLQLLKDFSRPDTPPQSLVLGQGKPNNSAKPAQCLAAWKALVAKSCLPTALPKDHARELSAYITDRSDGRSQYYVGLAAPADVNHIYTLGMEFLFDHVQLGVEMDVQKEWIEDTDMSRWRNSIALWQTEKVLQDHIKGMRSNPSAEKYIFKCVHQPADDLKDGCQLVGFAEFSIFKEQGERKLFCSKLKITEKHQNNYVGRHVYMNGLNYLTKYMAQAQPRTWANLKGCVLKVFSGNQVARSLYESLGYRMTSESTMNNLPKMTMARMDSPNLIGGSDPEDSDGYEIAGE